MVIRILKAALGDVGHMAIGAGEVPPPVSAQEKYLVVGVLGLDHGGLAQGVGPVGELQLVVVFFLLFQGYALVPGKDHLLVRALEIIFDMALGADQAAHFLVGGFLDVPSLPALESLRQGRPGDGQVHGGRIMAVGAAYGVDGFGPQGAPGGLVIILHAQLLHQAGHVRALAGPAGGLLYIFQFADAGRPGPQGGPEVFNGEPVPPGRVIVPGEEVAGPDRHHVRPVGQDVLRHVAQVLASEIHFPGFLPGFVFPGVVEAPAVVAGLDPGDLHLLVVVYGGHLGPPEGDGRGQQTQENHARRDAGENRASQNPGPVFG